LASNESNERIYHQSMFASPTSSGLLSLEQSEDLFHKLDRLSAQEQEKESRSTYLQDTFHIDELLREGAFSSVYQCRDKSTNKEYAVKKIAIISGTGRSIKREINVMKSLDQCPYVVQLHNVFRDADYYYLTLEMLSGGDLIDALDRKEVFSESEARIVGQKLLTAVAYMHEKRIAHRDIKADNIFVNATDTDIKLCDFGCAKVIENGLLHTLCGSAQYVAPEVLKQAGYDQQCDLWSVGVVVYSLLGGYLPFNGEANELPALVCSGEFHFHEKYWADISNEAKYLITSLLVVNPMQRFTAQQALIKSKWLRSMNKEEEHVYVPEQIAVPTVSKKKHTSLSPLSQLKRLRWGRGLLRMAKQPTTKLFLEDDGISSLQF
jgi:serine/threonine protein kinase